MDRNIYMRMSLEELMHYTTLAIDAGVQSYMRGQEPTTDRIKLSDAKRYIRRMGKPVSLLDAWERNGLIRSEKTGEAKNAAVWYSLTDIKTLLASTELKTICNNQHI